MHVRSRHTHGHSSVVLFYCACSAHEIKPKPTGASPPPDLRSKEATLTAYTKHVQEVLRDNRRTENQQRKHKTAHGGKRHAATARLGCDGAVVISEDLRTGAVTITEAPHSTKCVAMARRGDHEQAIHPELRKWIRQMFAQGVAPRVVTDAINHPAANDVLKPPRPPDLERASDTAPQDSSFRPRRWYPDYSAIRRIYDEHPASLNLHPSDLIAINCKQLVGSMQKGGVLLHHQDNTAPARPAGREHACRRGRFV
jgi:hypothetical protein